jgi:hypothetical protein
LYIFCEAVIPVAECSGFIPEKNSGHTCEQQQHSEYNGGGSGIVGWLGFEILVIAHNEGQDTARALDYPAQSVRSVCFLSCLMRRAGFGHTRPTEITSEYKCATPGSRSPVKLH